MGSIRWRLTIYHALAILGIAALLIGVGLLAFYRSVQTAVEETTHGRLIETAQLLEAGSMPTATQLTPLTEGGVWLIIRDTSGRVLAEAGSPPNGFGSLDQTAQNDAWRAALASGETESRSPGELFVSAVPIADTGSGAAVVEAWTSADTTAEGFLPDVRVITFLVPAVLLLAIGGSWLLVNSALKPVQQIAASARQIGDESLDRRLPVERNDEIGHLAATFNDLLARLEGAMTERDDALEQQRRFLADASHELRTPLAAIRGYAHMLDDWALNDPALTRESVAAIERDAIRMSVMVDQLMQLARGDDPDLSPKPAQTDLTALVRGASADAHRMAGDCISITAETPETAFATVDPMQIRQVLDILFDNAVKYTPDGGMVSARVTRSPGFVTITIADSGPGIPADELPYIFDRFYRADSSRSTSGVGLGLSIAKQIVARHSGSLQAANAPAGGAQFTVRLPAVD